MNWLTNFRCIKVEITSHCNAKCPGCTRNITGGKNISNLDLSHMPFELWKRIMHEDTKGMDLQEVLFDGNVGDLLMHPHALDFIKTTVEAHPKIHIQVNTNGGARTQQFWADMGEYLSTNKIPHKFNFAIDGLEDTHHIHRRSTTYDVVVRNMKAFIDAGGQASWVYTLFDHNIHQQEEAEARADELGCHWFQIRHSCIPGEDLYTKTDTEEYSIGTDNIYDYDEKLQLKKNKIVESETIEFIDHSCSAFSERQIQIDFRGMLWPCSYIYATEVFNDKPLSVSPFYFEGSKDPLHEDYIAPEMEHPRNKLNLHKHTLPEILTNDFFANQLPSAIENKRLNVCNKWCFN